MRPTTQGRMIAISVPGILVSFGSLVIFTFGAFVKATERTVRLVAGPHLSRVYHCGAHGRRLFADHRPSHRFASAFAACCSPVSPSTAPPSLSADDFGVVRPAARHCARDHDGRGQSGRLVPQRPRVLAPPGRLLPFLDQRQRRYRTPDAAPDGSRPEQFHRRSGLPACWACLR